MRSRTLAALLLALAFVSPAFTAPPDPRLTDIDLRVLAELTGERTVDQLILHYRPADFTADRVDRCAKANAAAFHDLERLLDVKYAGTIHIFLYADHADLKKRTESDAVAFSTGTASVHQPADFVSVHELCHIFALQFPRAVPQGATDIFVVEGLATALAQSDENIPIHAWAAAYARARRLPPLWDFRWSWPSKTPPGVHPYHVAGSFVGFLVERYGIAKVKAWYVDATEARAAFGKSFPELEHDWREWLGAYSLDPQHESHVFSKLGLQDARLPEALAAAPGVGLFDGASLAGLEPEAADRWGVRDGSLVGTHDGPWTAIRSKERFAAADGVRVRFRMRSGNAFKVTLEADSGKPVEVIFARWAGFVTCGKGYAGGPDARLDDTSWHTAVVTWKTGPLTVYLDGLRLMECPESKIGTNLRIGLGVERAAVDISEFAVIKP